MWLSTEVRGKAMIDTIKVPKSMLVMPGAIPKIGMFLSLGVIYGGVQNRNFFPRRSNWYIYIGFSWDFFSLLHLFSEQSFNR